jgi:hypothetical protein
MLAGARNLAFGATIVMAGLFAVMLAERAWIVLFLPPPDAPVFFDEPEPWSLMEALASGYTQSLVGVALMIWLVGRMVRRASKSIAPGR